MKTNEFREFVREKFSDDDELLGACEQELLFLGKRAYDDIGDPWQFIDEVEIKYFHVNKNSEKIMSTALKM